MSRLQRAVYRLADGFLVDDDKGVDMDGHYCDLFMVDDRILRRRCQRNHPSLINNGVYVGMPLVREDLTSAEVAEAAGYGAEPALTAWALSTIADREDA